MSQVAVVAPKGIKEVKELVKGLFELSKVSAAELVDGFQAQDIINGYVKISADPVKKAALEEALKGIQEIPAEMKDISFAEGLELAIFVMQEMPSLLEAFKKKAV
jgi:hypothetical protein